VAQERFTKLVTHIPKAPLYTLVLTNILFVALSIALAVLVIARSGGEVCEIQARLSIKGLVIDIFKGRRAKERVESIEDLFKEKYV
jgi:lipopolysaccharide/colanic/teichoic acid biosynthesis glycosyltransferase